jgi:hypothetical protein
LVAIDTATRTVAVTVAATVAASPYPNDVLVAL